MAKILGRGKFQVFFGGNPPKNMPGYHSISFALNELPNICQMNYMYKAHKNMFMSKVLRNRYLYSSGSTGL